MAITYVPSDLWRKLADVVDDSAAEHIVQTMRLAMTTSARPDAPGLTPERDPFYAAVYYGPESNASPVLSFACLQGMGVFVTVNLSPEDLGGQTHVYVHSDDYSQVYPFRWGQDDVAVPQAFVVPLETAVRIVEHFCSTGTMAPDDRWRDYERTGWDLYDAPENG